MHGSSKTSEPVYFCTQIRSHYGIDYSVWCNSNYGTLSGVTFTPSKNITVTYQMIAGHVQASASSAKCHVGSISLATGGNGKDVTASGSTTVTTSQTIGIDTTSVDTSACGVFVYI